VGGGGGGGGGWGWGGGGGGGGGVKTSLTKKAGGENAQHKEATKGLRNVTERIGEPGTKHVIAKKARKGFVSRGKSLVGM